jgi:Predicted archaeal kinase (sugar kinase superfamily)
MIKAYCPSHITCFFRPVESPNILSKGSLGAGIRLESGTILDIDEKAGNTRIFINGEETEANITRSILEKMIPDRGFEVNIEIELPLGQGFGMSASGAVAMVLCAADIVGVDRHTAFVNAHIADIEGGGGLGDVAALMKEAHQPVRVRAGMPPDGEVIDTKMTFDKLTLAVLGPKLKTSSVLSDKECLRSLIAAGDYAMSDFLNDVSKEHLFSLSNRFSSSTGVEQKEVSQAMDRLRSREINVAMCMLGNSIFSEASEEEVKEILGEDIWTLSVRSTDRRADIIQKG